jgi:hypothetical protein
MKPMSLITSRARRRRDSFDGALRKFGRQPFTDYSYHSGAFEQSSGYHLPVQAASFRNIGGDYFKYEARHDFWSEAVLFGVITLTAALPLMNNLHALIEFVRALTF